MHIRLKNPNTGEIKQIKVGFSWILLFFSAFLGLPLFLRRLYVWGGVFLTLWAVNLLGPAIASSPQNGAAIQLIMFFVLLGLSIWAGIKGNEMTAKNLLEHGWQFAEPESDSVKFAKIRWRLA